MEALFLHLSTNTQRLWILYEEYIDEISNDKLWVFVYQPWTTRDCTFVVSNMMVSALVVTRGICMIWREVGSTTLDSGKWWCR